jgi:hypothetical protein
MATTAAAPAAVAAAAACALLACHCCDVCGAAGEQPRPPTPFISAASFAGAKPGYIFRTGDHGIGYYRDIRASPPKVTAPEAPPELSLLKEVASLAAAKEPEPEPEPARPVPEFVRPVDVPIATWPRERVSDGAAVLTLYCLRASLPALLREYSAAALSEALQVNLAADNSRAAVLVLALPEEDGAGLLTVLALDATPQDASVSEGVGSFLRSLSAVPFSVSSEYRKELALLLEAVSSPDSDIAAEGLGAEPAALPRVTAVTPPDGAAVVAELQAVHLLALCDPIDPPRPETAAEIIRLAAQDWVCSNAQ